jgi:hypothetical protein
MKQPPVTYDTVRPVALALPQVEERTSSRTPAVRVNRKPFVRRHQDWDKIVVKVPFGRRAALMTADPDLLHHRSRSPLPVDPGEPVPAASRWAA